MIAASFQKRDGVLFAVQVSGHAEYADPGEDIVCAAVSSAVQLTANLMTEWFSISAKVSAKGDTIRIRQNDTNPQGGLLLAGLHAHLQAISEEYAGTIKLMITEV